MRVDLVVTRHPALAEYLREQGLVASEVPVVAHVTDPSILDGKVVAGVLPLFLAGRCKAVVEVQLDIPVELRGKELSLDQMRQYSRGLYVHRVESESL